MRRGLAYVAMRGSRWDIERNQDPLSPSPSLLLWLS